MLVYIRMDIGTMKGVEPLPPLSWVVLPIKLHSREKITKLIRTFN